MKPVLRKRFLPLLLLMALTGSFCWYAHKQIQHDQASRMLVAAVLLGEAEEVKDLLAAGADPDMRSTLPAPPRSLWSRIRNLLSPGDRKAQRGTGPTLVVASLQLGSFEIARRLVENGADPNLVDTDGQTPLHWAIGDPATVRLLLEKGAKADVYASDYMTPLSLAVIGDDFESAQLLLNQGADPSARPPEMALLAKPASVRAVPHPGGGNSSDTRGPGSGGQPPWSSSAGSTANGGGPSVALSGEQLIALLSFSPPFTRAIDLGRTRFAKLFLSAGVSLPKDRDGRYYLLNLACASGNVETVRLLLDRGFDADTSAPNAGVTPLMYAAGAGLEPEILRLLIERGASLDRRDGRFKWTPLEWAKRGEPHHRNAPNTRWPPKLRLNVARHVDDRSPSDPVAVGYYAEWRALPRYRKTYFAEDIHLLERYVAKGARRTSPTRLKRK